MRPAFSLHLKGNQTMYDSHRTQEPLMPMRIEYVNLEGETIDRVYDLDSGQAKDHLMRTLIWAYHKGVKVNLTPEGNHVIYTING